eukprot:COSAG06_NODE_163_length_21566_cov_9.641070_18_plen_382_part_00
MRLAVLGALLLLLLLLRSHSCAAVAPKPPAADPSPGWPVGWGFASRGGFPPLPPSWRSFSLQRATVGYFMGNASGMDSTAELQAEAKLGIVGIGWQLNNIPSHHSNLEEYELQEAARLKALRGGSSLRVMLTRESEATTTLYNSSKAKMMDPANRDWWVRCGDAPCAGKWYSPAGNTLKYWFNFSNPDATDWWLNEFIGVPLDNPLVDGIYFDSAPDDAPPDSGATQGQGGGVNRADAQAAFDRALKLIAFKGKWASAWNNDGQSLFPKSGLRPDAKPSYFGPDSCSSLVKEWIRLGKRDDITLQVQIGTNSPRNETIAAFLIGRGVSATLEYPLNLGEQSHGQKRREEKRREEQRASSLLALHFIYPNRVAACRAGQRYV